MDFMKEKENAKGILLLKLFMVICAMVAVAWLVLSPSSMVGARKTMLFVALAAGLLHIWNL